MSPAPNVSTPIFPMSTDTLSFTAEPDHSHRIDMLEPSLSPVQRSTIRSVGWSGLKTLLRVVDASAGIFPPLKWAVGGLNASIEVFENASKGRKEYLELLVNLDTILADLSGYIASGAGSKMTASMMNICIGLGQELKIVQDKSAGGLEHLDNAANIMKSCQRVQGHLERLKMNANLGIWQIISNLETEARLKSLMPTTAAVYNSAESEDVHRRACTPNTREKELRQLLDWAYKKLPSVQDVYWVNGMAGTGKTTIAYSFCAELKKSAQLGASFFCSRSTSESCNVKSIFPSIAYQLARFSRPFYCALSAILQEEPDAHTRVVRAQFETLLVRPLTQVKQTLPEDFIVVIDALDECENGENIGQLLDVLLSYAADSALPMRFLITSRPEPAIYHRMMSRVENNLDARLVLHDSDAQLVKHDIEIYLRTELASVYPTPSQISCLVELSGLLFIFASTAARYIKEGIRYMEHEDRLDTILGLSSEPTDGKNKEMDKFYTSILQAVFHNESISKSVHTRLKIILDTIICVQEPMTVDALASLLGMKSGHHVDTLLRSLSSVVKISESNGLVTILHPSFSDYMLDQERSASFHCNPTLIHTQLSRRCQK